MLKTLHQFAKIKIIPRERKNLMRRRSRINKLILRITSPARKLRLSKELVEIEKSLQKSYKKSKTTQEQLATNSVRKNPKYFFNYAKKFSKKKTKVGPLLDKNKKYENNPKKMAELLSEHYSSMFSNPKPETPTNEVTEPTPTIQELTFTEEDIKDAISELSSNSAPGSDGFPALLPLNCKELLSNPLKMAWQES